MLENHTDTKGDDQIDSGFFDYDSGINLVKERDVSENPDLACSGVECGTMPFPLKFTQGQISADSGKDIGRLADSLQRNDP